MVKRAAKIQSPCVLRALKRLCGAIYFGSPETWASASYGGPPDVSAVRAKLKAEEEKVAAANKPAPAPAQAETQR